MSPSLRRDLIGLAQTAVILVGIGSVVYFTSLGFFATVKPVVGHVHDPRVCESCKQLQETDRKAPGGAKFKARGKAGEEVSPPLF